MSLRKKFLILLLSALAFTVPFVSAAEPQNVTGLSALVLGTDSVALSWNAAKDSNGDPVKLYRVYFGTQSVTDPKQDYEDVKDTANNTTTYQVTGLTANTTYYFAVTAVDQNDEESLEYSNEVSAKTAASAEQQADTTAPTVAKVSAPDNMHVKVEFSEAVKLPATLPELYFTIKEQLIDTNSLTSISAKMDAADASGKTVVVETSEQKAGLTYVLTVGANVMDLAGNPIASGNADSGLFTGSATAPVTETLPVPALQPTTPAEATALEEAVGAQPDTTPPEDVTNLLASFKEQLDKFVVLLDWKASVNSAKDLVDQLVYMSLDRGKNYGQGQSLGPVATHYEAAGLEGGKEYTFKVTTKDAAGNESVGAVKSIRLPQTGVGVGLLVLLSAATAGSFLRRKR